MLHKDKEERILPPGVRDQPNYGTMWIKVGTLKLIRNSKVEYSVRCQFWGEEAPVILKTRSDMPNNERERIQIYNIKCPVVIFVQYLQDIKNNLKLEVEGLGKVNLNLAKFVDSKREVTIFSRQAFDHFNGFFEVVGQGNRKLGSLEIEMGTSFDPEVAEAAFKELDQRTVPQQVQGDCPCEQSQKEVQANKQTNQPTNQEDDQRIPHSLDTEQRPQSEFDATKYEPKPQQSQMLAQIPQILTYSGLRLDEEVPIAQRDQASGQSAQIDESEKVHEIRSMQLKGRQEQKAEAGIEQLIGSEEESDHQVVIRPKLGQDQLYRQFYGATEKPEQQPTLQRAEILSRVVNLDQELRKEGMNLDEGISREEPSRDGLSRGLDLDQQMKRESIKHRTLNFNMPPKLQHDSRTYIMNFAQNGPTFKNLQVAPSQTDSRVGTRNRQPRKTATNLLLNLLIEIKTDSVKVPTPNKFIVVHRTYGSKQRNTLGPSFGDIITILCPVSESEIRKMHRNPFLVEFWDSVTGSFLGILRLNLSKINKGFLLNGRLNEIAIKTNVLPTTIQRGVTAILDVGDAETGSCEIYAAIGTSGQLNAHLNQSAGGFNWSTTGSPQRDQQQGHQQGNHQIYRPDNRLNNQQTPSQTHQTHKASAPSRNSVQQSASPSNLVLKFDKVLTCIDENSTCLIDNLLPLAHHKFVNKSQIVNILGGYMEQSESIPVLDYLVSLSPSEHAAKHELNFSELSASFDQHKDILVRLNHEYRVRSTQLRTCLHSKSQIISKIRHQSSFHTVSKSILQSILLDHVKEGSQSFIVKDYVELFTSYVNIDYVEFSLDSSRSQSARAPRIMQFEARLVNRVISTDIVSRMQSRFIDADRVLNSMENSANVSVKRLIGLLESEKVAGCGVWGILHMFEHIGTEFEIQGTVIEQIPLNCLYNYIHSECRRMQDLKQSATDPEPEQQEPVIHSRQEASLGETHKQQSQEQIVGKERPQPIQIHPPAQKEAEHPPQKEAEHPSAQKEAEHPPQKQTENLEIHRHLFSIEPLQLWVERASKGTCVVSYIFPFEQEQIKSKSFTTFTDKHRYPLKMFGTHGFSIEDSLENYLGDNLIKFVVRTDNRIEYEGALHADELCITPNSQQNKVIPLFSDGYSGMSGKLKLGIQYERARSNEQTLGKETTYQLFLPKAGYINYQVSTQLDLTKLRSQINIKEEYYIVLTLDLFHSSNNLRTLFPAVSSSLHPSTQVDRNPITIKGALKINLSSVVLDYIKNKSARLALNTVYYAKDYGNYDRKQVMYAHIDLPLINIIKSQGIVGDYAFKNKLGMFVSLGQCDFKYEKNRNQLYMDNNAALNPTHQHRYWLILHFLEFINFETELVPNLHWIKFELVLNGRKYSTEKVQLNHQTITPISNSAICINNVSEQDFFSVKIMPITVVTNIASVKLAIDINMKSVCRNVTHQKCSISNQYFLAVDQNNRCTRIRTGLKMFTFKGGSNLTHFIQSLQRNLQSTEIFNEMILPEEINDYDKMLTLFRNNLHLSARTLDDTLSQLLVNKRRDKLPLEFFTMRTCYKLDFTPIIAEECSDFPCICQYLPGCEIDKSEVLNYLRQNNVRLTNFREQFLNRFTFKQLNSRKLDKNVEFLRLQDEVDLITFVRKVKVQSAEESDLELSQHRGSRVHYKQLTITVLEGSNFHQLYNGIKPNCMVRIPELGIQTQPILRNSNPFFNENFVEYIETHDLSSYRKLRVEAYHCTNCEGSDPESQTEHILIAEGTLLIPLESLKNTVPAQKIIKATLHSVMSSQMKANLNIKISLGEGVHDRSEIHAPFNSQVNIDPDKWDSRDASRIGEMMHEIKADMVHKKNLFDSSDDDEY